MFRAKTVFVIGAGASAEFGLPLGNALLKDVSKRIDISYEFGRLSRGDYVVAEALGSTLKMSEDVTEYNEHLKAGWQLVKSSSQGLSIDNVLDALEDERASRIGKFGIVRSILESEEKLNLTKWAEHFPADVNVAEYENTWLSSFTKLLTENVRKSEVAGLFSNIKIINFNYDRIFEQYLPFAVAEYYGLKASMIQELMADLAVYRPYGKAGYLPWEKGEPKVPFGHSRVVDVELAASNILTFTEQVRDRDLVEGIQTAIAEADRIIFLGFGYHRQNLQLLDTQGQEHLQIFGTTYGMSNSDIEVVGQEIEGVLRLHDFDGYTTTPWFKPYSLKCYEFLSEIWRTLTSVPGESNISKFPRVDQNLPDLSSFGRSIGS